MRKAQIASVLALAAIGEAMRVSEDEVSLVPMGAQPAGQPARIGLLAFVAAPVPATGVH